MNPPPPPPEKKKEKKVKTVLLLLIAKRLLHENKFRVKINWYKLGLKQSGITPKTIKNEQSSYFKVSSGKRLTESQNLTKYADRTQSIVISENQLDHILSLDRYVSKQTVQCRIFAPH